MKTIVGYLSRGKHSVLWSPVFVNYHKTQYTAESCESWVVEICFIILTWWQITSKGLTRFIASRCWGCSLRQRHSNSLQGSQFPHFTQAWIVCVCVNFTGGDGATRHADAQMLIKPWLRQHPQCFKHLLPIKCSCWVFRSELNPHETLENESSYVTYVLSLMETGSGELVVLIAGHWKLWFTVHVELILNMCFGFPLKGITWCVRAH